MTTTTTPSDFFRNLNVFSGSEHLSFRWDGGEPAALLVHGFPGTPADMRSLARSLHRAGWTVEAPLLPGFGPQIGSLPERRYEEWAEAVRQGVARLKRDHDPVVVIGHSMGAAVALLASTQGQPAGQALLAPYWRFGPSAPQLLWPVLRRLFSRWQPFKRMDFQNPHVRAGLFRVFLGLDLDDPFVQNELRAFAVPVGVLDQIYRLGRSAFRAAADTRTPTVVVQGIRDRLVRPHHTYQLLRQLPNATIEMVSDAHNIIVPTCAAWNGVEGAVLRFAASTLAAPSAGRAP